MLIMMIAKMMMMMMMRKAQDEEDAEYCEDVCGDGDEQRKTLTMKMTLLTAVTTVVVMIFLDFCRPVLDLHLFGC